ncbi:transposase family protein [Actinomyces oris]|uniref:transposase family protein n=1 Tax=Actinomyces oris TaxID=544580 RepID=UPI003D2F0D2B
MPLSDRRLSAPKRPPHPHNPNEKPHPETQTTPTCATQASPPRHIGDKGYIGLGMITPKRKPAKLPLHPDDKAYNRAVNQIRYKIERVIANIKTWRVLHTGYRRPPETITTWTARCFSDSACFVLQAAFFRSRKSLSASSGVRYPRAE